jgi:serralysin
LYLTKSVNTFNPAQLELSHFGLVGCTPMTPDIIILPGVITMATVVSQPLTGNQNIDGILYTTKWTGPVTYAFPNALPSYYGAGDLPGFTQVSIEQREVMRGILGGTNQTSVNRYGNVASFTNLDMSEQPTFNGAADLRIFQADSYLGSNIGTARVVEFPTLGQSLRGGDVVYDSVDNGGSARTPVKGDYYYHQHLHELGHALGLKHGHDGSYGSLVALSSNLDAMEYTVMTYRSYQNGPLFYSNEQYGYAQTYMSLDILALQTLYGADYTTNSGNTVYAWSPGTGEMFLNGVGQGVAGANRIFMTVWDGGGNDWYDMSNYTSGVTIDLRAGGYSTTATSQLANLGGGNKAHGNVYNSFLFENNTASLIENAKGTNSADIIYGNEVANLIYGYGGDDILSGGAGGDTFVGGIGNDAVAYNLDIGTRGIYVNLAAGVAIDTSGAVDTLLEIEYVNGTNYAYPGGYWSDFLIGGNANNVINGNAGNDYISGGYGIDYLSGGAGVDWFILGSEIQLNSYDIIADFNVGGELDYFALSAAYQGITSFGDGVGYAYAYVNFGASGGYAVLAYGTTAAQLQSQTLFS